MPIHIDEDQIRAATRRCLAKLEAQMADPAFAEFAVQARFQLAQGGSFDLALAREINRDTPPDVVFDAVANLMANMALGVIDSLTHPEETPERSVLANQILLNFAKKLQSGLRGDFALENAETVLPVASGRA